ncbi:endonuclease/exonuclease/phosphatase family protein [Shewanella waksmanii]|uniref:endonuclease/exonuclease/phosphatase family protein n=1 Tax=Shewanella waksmanii TaxID=213783 RepID=UPI0037368B3D
MGNATCKFKISTLNLFNFVDPPNAYYDFENIYTAQQWQKKLTWIAHYLASEQPDIIAFQEVFSIDVLKRLLADCGYEYVCVVDEPTVVDEFIYRDPVVALASKHPITQTTRIDSHAEILPVLSLPSDFAFSRVPLLATVNLPQFGELDLFVIHFKSQRGTLSTEEITNKDMSATEMFALEAASKWAAAQQRGAEATLLRYAIASRRAKTQNPCAVLGDFNDSLHNGVLSTLVSQDSRLKTQLSPNEFIQYSLHDAYQLFEANHYARSAIDRPATHYHLNKGNVLDYILLSAEFNSQNDQSLAEVISYQTFDQHLTSPQYDRDSHSSDHAAVSVTCRIRS